MDLSELGLTKNEIKVFTTLIKFEKLSAVDVSREAEVSYGRVYDILGSLEQKGLVRVVPDKIKYFMASNPQVLEDMVKEKQKKLKEINIEVEKLKRIYAEDIKEPVQIVKGQKNFYKLLKELKEAKNEELNIKYNVEYNYNWAKAVKFKLKDGIIVKDLIRYSDETKNDIKKWKKIQPNMRIIENEGVVISLRDREEMIISLVKSNVSLLIKDKAFSKLMGELMNRYYEKMD